MLPFVMFGIKVSSIQSLVPCVVTSPQPSPPAHPLNIGGSEGGEWEAGERDSRCVEREVMVGNS